MAVTEMNVRSEYVGNNTLSQYTFDFKIQKLSEILITVISNLGVPVFTVRGDDTTYITSVVFNPFASGGVVNLPANLATGYRLIILYANDVPTQITEIRSKGDFNIRRIEDSLDSIVRAVQRVAYLASKGLRIPDGLSDSQIFNTNLPVLSTDIAVSDNRSHVIAIGQDNASLMLGPSLDDLATQEANAIAAAAAAAASAAEAAAILAEMEAGGGGGVPAGGLANAILQKNTDTEGDADWTDPIVYSGFTTRFSELINLQGAKAVIDYIMKMGYAPPTLSLGGSVSTAAREIGNAISSVDLSAVVGKILDNITTVRFYLQPSTLLATQTSGPAIPNGGTNIYTYATPFSTTTSFRAEVDDVSAQAKPSRSATLTYSFYFPYFSGKGAAAVTPATIYSSFAKTINTTPATVAVAFSFAIGEKPYFAYPATFADLTSIKNVNNLETLGSWTKRTENMTNAYGQTTSYKIYEFNNLAGVANDNTYTFIR